MIRKEVLKSIIYVYVPVPYLVCIVLNENAALSTTYHCSIIIDRAHQPFSGLDFPYIVIREESFFYLQKVYIIDDFRQLLEEITLYYIRTTISVARGKSREEVTSSDGNSKIEC